MAGARRRHASGYTPVDCKTRIRKPTGGVPGNPWKGNGESSLQINFITIFPGFFEAALSFGIPARARQAGLVDYRPVDLREFTVDRHRTVDDLPYGGGPGMVMKPEPFFRAVAAVRTAGPVVLLSPRGRVFSQKDARRYAVEGELTLLCGHYKDVDERVAAHLATEELSVGDFVLSGGEPAALTVADTVVRLLPGALGDHASASTDSHYDAPLLSAPSWTRPPDYRGHRVPGVLLSGDHARIEAFRAGAAERLTRERRPDLWERWASEDEG